MMKNFNRNASAIFYVLSLFFLSLEVSFASASAEGVTVGAIRWDAWYGPKDGTGQAVVKSLSPKAWHYRLPFFGKVISDTKISIPDYSQDIMDKEIQFAHDGAIDYWAFLLYPESYAMSEAIHYYLKSSKKNLVRFSAMVSPQNLYPQAQFQSTVERILNYFKDSSYQKISEDRPLLYLYVDKKENFKIYEQFLPLLRSKCKALHIPDPYAVLMFGSPSMAHEAQKNITSDAISAYTITKTSLSHQTYKSLTDIAEKYWEEELKTGSSVVPTIMAGWDRRPRVENPMPWETSLPPQNIDWYFKTPTPAQLAAHLKRAIHWTQDHASASPAQTVLVYAWNEHDEGGWINPTLSEGNARLRAIRKVVKSTKK